MTKRQKAIQQSMDYAKSILTVKGYREFLWESVTRSTEYYQNGGRAINIKDFEHKPK